MPIACITGDVHHFLGPNITREEHILTEEYMKVVREQNAKTTLFVTGKCIKKRKSFWKSFMSKYSDYVELGGHTYSALKPRIIHLFFKWFFNSYYGPYFYQYMDISKTVAAFSELGIYPASWRTHSYQGDFITFEILEKLGFNVVSDIVRVGELKILKTDKLCHVPINVKPDDLIYSYYFERNRERMICEGKRIMQSLYSTATKKLDIVAQLHPSAMKILDNFDTFEEILRVLRQHNYVFATLSELPRLHLNIEDLGFAIRLVRGHISTTHSLKEFR